MRLPYYFYLKNRNYKKDWFFLFDGFRSSTRKLIFEWNTLIGEFEEIENIFVFYEKEKNHSIFKFDCCCKSSCLFLRINFPVFYFPILEFSSKNREYNLKSEFFLFQRKSSLSLAWFRDKFCRPETKLKRLFTSDSFVHTKKSMVILISDHFSNSKWNVQPNMGFSFLHAK